MSVIIYTVVVNKKCELNLNLRMKKNICTQTIQFSRFILSGEKLKLLNIYRVFYKDDRFTESHI